MRMLLTVLARIILTFVFIFSGIMKFVKQDEFIESLAQIPILDNSLFPVLGILVPAAEIALAVALGVGFFTKFVSFVTAVVILIFTALYIPVLIDPTANAQCACFGVSSDIDMWFVFRNVFLFGTAFFLFTQDEFRYSLDQLRKKT
jgi:uncharacterized membrane protein YphA (DoxX/SURF4 family)